MDGCNCAKSGAGWKNCGKFSECSLSLNIVGFFDTDKSLGLFFWGGGLDIDKSLELF